MSRRPRVGPRAGRTGPSRPGRALGGVRRRFRDQRAGRGRQDAIFLATALAWVAFDQITKLIVRGTLTEGDHERLAPFFRFSHFENSGGAFNLFNDTNTLLAVSALVAIVCSASTTSSRRRPTGSARLGLALILGGAVGNLLDRVYQGSVTDFINFNEFPAFNVADAGINVGVVLILVHARRARRHALPRLTADAIRSTPPRDAPSEIMADGDGERLDVFVARRLPPSPAPTRGASSTRASSWSRAAWSGPRTAARRRDGARAGRARDRRDGRGAHRHPPRRALRGRRPDRAQQARRPHVHPAPGEREPTLVNALLAHCPDLQQIGDALRPGLVHRLDKDTSGVMMVAKHAVSLQRLQDQIRARSVEKRYLAVVAGTPDPLQGRVEAPVGRDRSDPRRMAVVEGGKPSTGPSTASTSASPTPRCSTAT